MNLSEAFPVSEFKRADLFDRIRRLGIQPSLIQESFTRGGGKGGQKINKTSNRVVLTYEPYGLVVHCQRERSRSLNRFLALRELVDQIEMKVSPHTSARLKKFNKIRKNKESKKRRAENKYHTGA